MLTTKKQADPRGSRPFSAWGCREAAGRSWIPWGLAALLGLGIVGCTPPGPRALLRGERLIEAGDYADAVVQLETAVRLLPAEARAYNHLGLAYHGAGRLDDAVAAYQRALLLDRDLAAARYNLGCLYLERRNPTNAVAELTTYTALQPTDPAGWLRLAGAQLQSRQVDAAERSYQRALQLKPNSAVARNGLGLVLVSRSNYAAALQQFQAAAVEEAGYAPALLNAAITAQQHLKNRSLALRCYQDYLAVAPGSPAAVTVQRIVSGLQSESLLAAAPPTPEPAARTVPSPRAAEPARTQVTTRRESSPREPTPATSTARSSSPSPRKPVDARPPEEVVRLPRPAPATGSAPAVVALPAPALPRPGSPAATADVSRAKAPPATAPASNPPPRLAAGPDAQPPPAPAAPRDRETARRLVLEGLEAQDRGRLSEAIERYREAAKADPSMFEAHYNLAVTAHDSGRRAEAVSAYEAALTLQPGNTRARLNYGIALEESGRPREAAAEFVKVVGSEPTNVQAHFNLGNLYERKLGDPIRAKTHYRRVLELDPQHSQATAIRFWLEGNP